MLFFDYIFVGVLLLLVLPVFWMGCSIVCSAFSDAPFVPLEKHNIERMFQLIDFSGKKKIYDLGSGDGRILIAMLKQTRAQCVGIERVLLLRILARLRIFITHGCRRIRILSGNFFDYDLSSADVVVCYLFPKVMGRLEGKFREELSPGTIVISFSFEISSRSPIIKDKPDERSRPIFVYQY